MYSHFELVVCWLCHSAMCQTVVYIVRQEERRM